MTEDDRLRAFLAIPRDRMWIESARGFLERRREAFPDASWTKPESWHVTIRFLGDVPRSTLDRIAQAIEPLARETVPGDLLPGGAVIFPPRGPARVLGAGFAVSPIRDGIERFAGQVSDRAEGFGVEAERRDFHPHVTLARLRHPWPREAVERFVEDVASWRLPPWPIRSCVLYESRLQPAGAVHVPLAEWTFAGGPSGVRA